MSERWSTAQRRLHWWSAALVLATLGLALLMTALPFTLLLAKFLAYQLHKTLGLLVLGMVVARLVLRGLRPAPPALGLSGARLGQALLYALLLVVPVLGYFTAQLAPGPVPTTLFLVIPVPHLLQPDPVLFALLRPVHQAAAWLLVSLAAGHAGLALWHHRHGVPVFSRIWGRALPPRQG